MAGNSRKAGDVINIRFLLSKALLFNGSTRPTFILLTKEISRFLWNRKLKEVANCNSCGIIVFSTVDRSVGDVFVHLHSSLFELISLQDFLAGSIFILSQLEKYYISWEPLFKSKSSNKHG